MVFWCLMNSRQRVVGGFRKIQNTLELLMHMKMATKTPLKPVLPFRELVPNISFNVDLNIVFVHLHAMYYATYEPGTMLMFLTYI